MFSKLYLSTLMLFVAAAACAQNIGAVLTSGGRLYKGQYMQSTDNKLKLIMQDDGNLVLYNMTNNAALWATSTYGSDAAYAVLQPDGNFMLCNNNQYTLWATGTVNHPGSRLALQNDGNMVLYDGSAPTWASDTYGWVKSGTSQPPARMGDNDRRPGNGQRDGIRGNDNAPAARGDEDRRPANSNQLLSGKKLNKGQFITSDDKRLKLVFQEDGNMVLYNQSTNQPLWYTATAGTDASYAIMQADGNFVIYTNYNKPLWASGTAGNGGAFLVVQNDGNMALYQGTNAVWATGTYNFVPVVNYTAEVVGGGMMAGDRLNKGQYIISADRRLKLQLQDNGNLVVFSCSKAFGEDPLWHTNTKGSDATNLVMQDDGNLVLYNNYRKVIWSSKTQGNPGASLVLQRDGDVVVTLNKKELWHSDTRGYLTNFPRQTPPRKDVVTKPQPPAPPQPPKTEQGGGALDKTTSATPTLIKSKDTTTTKNVQLDKTTATTPVMTKDKDPKPQPGTQPDKSTPATVGATNNSPLDKSTPAKPELIKSPETKPKPVNVMDRKPQQAKPGQ